MNVKKLFSVLLAVIMAVGVFSVGLTANAADIIVSGTCGDDLTWMLDSNGVLSIDGSGNMEDYRYSSAPWHDYYWDILSIVIGNSVTGIGSCAFLNCWSAKTVSIGNAVTYIGDSAFNSAGIEGVVIPNSVVSIGESAFHRCTKLESIIIPNSVKYIEDGAFWGCDNLTTVVIGNNVEYLGHANTSPEAIGIFEYYNGVFGNCLKLKSVTIGNSVKVIGDSTFENCLELSSVNIPNSVTAIGRYAFSNCGIAGSLTIPAATESIGYGAFSCDNLESISVSGNNSFYSNDDKGVLFNKNKTILYQYPYGNISVDYTVPSSVTTIWAGAFSGPSNYSYNLKKIIIPVTCLQIGYHAFSSCGESIIISNPDCSIDDTEFTFGSYSTMSVMPTIYGYSGSTAESYAERYERKFILIEDTAVYGNWYDNSDGTHSRSITYIDDTTDTETKPHEWSDWTSYNSYGDEPYNERYCLHCEAKEREDAERKTFDVDKTYNNESDGVEVFCPSETFPEGVELVTKHWSFSKVEDDYILEVWSIAFEKDGEAVQPAKPVMLKLNLPDGISPALLPLLTLWHYSDGQWSKMDTWIEDGKICCITDSFSPFAFNIGNDVPEKDGSQFELDLCKFCGKTHTGVWGRIVQFFHNILYFFAHLFGKR